MTAPGDNGGGFVVTLRDIYQLVVGLTARVDTALARGAQHDSELEDHDKQLGDHETRIRSLEQSRWPLPSAALLVALASAVIAFIVMVRGAK